MPQQQQSASGLHAHTTRLLQHRSSRPGAIRMARLRDRRERGFRVYQIEVCDADLNGLIARGLLDRLQRHDAAAVEKAIGALLDQIAV